MWRFLGVGLLLFLPACLDGSTLDDAQAEGSLSPVPAAPLITICHASDGAMHTITIAENMWPLHQDHGDMRGPCTVEDLPDEISDDPKDEPCEEDGEMPADETPDDGMDEGDDNGDDGDSNGDGGSADDDPKDD